MPGKADVLAAEYYHTYINKASDDELLSAIEKNSKNFRKLLKKIPKKKIDHAYAEGKWTIKELLQHIIDAERVFAFRALNFARKDASPLPSFDENNWAANSQAGQRSWNDLVDEFKTVRASNEIMFASFSDDQLRSIGIASGKEFNVLAIGYILAGHVEHHIDIIKDRYLTKKS